MADAFSSVSSAVSLVVKQALEGVDALGRHDLGGAGGAEARGARMWEAAGSGTFGYLGSGT